MAERTNAELRAALKDMLLHPPKGWGEFSLGKSVAFKDACAKARRAAEKVSTPRSTLIELETLLKTFY